MGARVGHTLGTIFLVSCALRSTLVRAALDWHVVLIRCGISKVLNVITLHVHDPLVSLLD